MIRIGIVGAENSHSAAIAKTLNVRRSVPGFRVVAIWGETKAFAEKTAESGKIPRIVRRPADMVGDIDAAIVDHRHAKYHLPAAEALLKAKLPMFIDKPFCYRLPQGKAFLARARRMKVPVTSFSTVPTSKCFAAFAKKVKKAGQPLTASSFGPCDLKSPYGGIFFYGIHQVDMLMSLFGPKVRAVSVNRARPSGDAIATLFWADGMTASMHCVRGGSIGFQASVATGSGPLSARLVSDPNPYLAGIRIFTRMFKTRKEPIAHSRILAPVAVLEALEKSINRKGGRVKVSL